MLPHDQWDSHWASARRLIETLHASTKSCEVSRPRDSRSWEIPDEANRARLAPMATLGQDLALEIFQLAALVTKQYSKLFEPTAPKLHPFPEPELLYTVGVPLQNDLQWWPSDKTKAREWITASNILEDHILKPLQARLEDIKQSEPATIHLEIGMVHTFICEVYKCVLQVVHLRILDFTNVEMFIEDLLNFLSDVESLVIRYSMLNASCFLFPYEQDIALETLDIVNQITCLGRKQTNVADMKMILDYVYSDDERRPPRHTRKTLESTSSQRYDREESIYSVFGMLFGELYWHYGYNDVDSLYYSLAWENLTGDLFRVEPGGRRILQQCPGNGYIDDPYCPVENTYMTRIARDVVSLLGNIFRALWRGRSESTLSDDLAPCIRFNLLQIKAHFVGYATLRQRLVEEPQLAVAMGSHPRLGGGSFLHALPAEVLRDICSRL